MIAKRIIANSERAGNSYQVEDESFARKHPEVFEWVTETKYGDGTNRVPGKVSFKIQDGKWLGTLSDEDQQACTFVSAATFEACLKALGKAVSDPGARWIVFSRDKNKKTK